MSIAGLLNEKFGDLVGNTLEIQAYTQHKQASSKEKPAILSLNVVYSMTEHHGTLVLTPIKADCTTHAPVVINQLQQKIKKKIDQLLSTTSYSKVPTVFVGGSQVPHLDRIQIKGV